MIRFSPQHSLGKDASTLDQSEQGCETSTQNKVLIAACLFLAQKVNDTEVAKIRDVINSVWISAFYIQQRLSKEELSQIDSDGDVAMVPDLRRINLSY